MIEAHVRIVGVDVVSAIFGKVAALPMKEIHSAMGTEAVERIRDRVESGLTLTGGPMPPSLRAIRQGGITLEDTGLMVQHSMGVKQADERKAVVAFDNDRAKIAYYNHHGAKTKNGKWRPRMRQFFGLGKGDEAAIRDAGQDVLDKHVKDAQR